MGPAVSLSIKVIPKSRENGIVGWENGTLKIRLQAVAEKGEANRELIRFLSQIVKIPQRDITLVKGATSRHKIITFEGITQEQLLERLRD
jgi:uncharacterized protein (TIGR00251 family)